MPHETQTVPQKETVLWDVVEEHLDELEFCVEQFERMLDDAELSLPHLSSIEARLFAHLDGLVVEGEPVIDRLIVPAIDDVAPDRPHRVTALGLAVTATGRHGLLPRI